MKKIILSIAAVAALAACTKSEVQYEQTGEITLAPVTSNTTKSVAGYYGDTFDGIFPTDIDLYVFANAGAEGSAATAHTEPYFKNAQFKWFTDTEKPNATNTTAAGGAYAGTPTRYWPNVKTLVFAGYSDACNIKANLIDDNDDTTPDTTPTMDFVNDKLTIPAYTQDNVNCTTEGANDLMWFSRTEPYSKRTNEIVAQMKHACSWITVKIIGDGVTGDNYMIQNLKIKNLYHKGKAVCGATEATWSEYAVSTDEDLFTAAIDATEAALQFPKDKNGENPNNPKVFENNANNFIVIPQEPTTLDVTYSYVSDATNSITFTETKSVELD